MARGILLITCLLACGTGPSVAQGSALADEHPLYGGAVVIAETGAAGAEAAGFWMARQRASMIAPRLLWRGADGGFRSGVVSAWTWDADLTTLTLHLAPRRAERAAWVSAADVATSLKKVLTSASASATALILRDIAGAETLARGAREAAGIEVLDETTVRLRFTRVQPLALDALADLAAAPLWNAAGSEAPGRGAFIADAAGTLTANIRCADGRPFLDAVVLGTAPPSLAAVRGGRARIELAPAAAQSRPLAFPGVRVVWLVANPAGQVLRTADQRRLVFDALDVDGMVRIFFGGADSRLRTLVPPAMVPGGLLSPGARPRGSGNLQALTLRIGYPRGRDDLRLAAERVRVDLILTGARCEVQPYDAVPPRNCDLLIVDALVHEGSPEYSLWRLLTRLWQATGSKLWIPQPERDAVRWLLSVDQSLRADGWVLPLYQAVNEISLDPRLRGVQFHADGTLRLDDAWLSPRSAQP